ncbi:glutathione synthase/RimK-type ligase-like ATP-grasp enzyme [Kibdelosporangium banguiense]|uniref:Glutathione synthase/RimK-type ligase-like ATP-grasp enzyme n=1 Tax=Kibdelosporangium banguiense TaxID=1365924 RepID=A0ABS4TE60_9PSEU|nr:ATP-grasp domain-containing protein [Kibdelosporangium banguiense]MBP2322641.1 glutathione synthase/RimK-type ligase-like ATP-grasp enzyme [Kibdelosporangium banguiense]
MSRTIDSVERACQAVQRLPLVGLAPRPIDLLPLLRLEALNQLWSCEDAAPDWPSRFGTDVVSLEHALGSRRRWRGVDVDALLPLVNPFIAASPAMGSLGLIPYTLTEHWRAALADAHGLTVAPSLASWPLPELVDKIRMRRWLRELRVPVPRSFAVRRADLRYAQLVLRLGSPFVLQLPTGSAGVGTYLVRTTGELERAVAQHPQVETWLASSYVGDRTVNIHGLVTGTNTVAVTRPSVQLTNLASVGAAFGAYAGSDFGAPLTLPAWILQRCHLAVRRIGQALAARGYHGIFGVDVAVDEQCVTVLEVNGRIQASTWLLGEIELETGVVPTLVRHVLEAYGHRTEQRSGGLAIQGTQLIVRHTGPDGMCLSVRPQPGVYSLRSSRLLWRRDGVGLLDCGPDEVVLADLPGASTVLESGAVLARVVTRRSLTASDGQSLNAEGTAILAALQTSWSLRPCAPALSPAGGL